MRDGHVRRRKHRREVFGHVGMLGSAFEVAKHLGRKLASSVDPAAFRPDAEALGSLVVEVGAPVVVAVGANPHISFCTRGPKSVLEWVTRSEQRIKNAGCRSITALIRMSYRPQARHLAHGFVDSVCKMRLGVLGSCNPVMIQDYNSCRCIPAMELIDHWSHSANTLLLVVILLAILVSLIASGLSVVPTAILLCIGLTTIFFRSSLAAYLTDDEESETDSDDSLGKLKQQYVRGEISEAELEDQLSSSLEEERVESRYDRQPAIRERE